MTQVRMIAFQVRQFASVPYFVQLMVLTTVASSLVQYLGVRAWGTPVSIAWIRGGIIGMWTTCTASAGILGFERYKGTLVHLVLARAGSVRAIFAVVSAAATFGILAFPVSWMTVSVGEVADGRGLGQMSLGGVRQVLEVVFTVGLLWVACVAVSLVISSIFVLTPNAISYEGLLLVPVFLASGIMFTSAAAPPALVAVGRLVPLSGPSAVLLGQSQWTFVSLSGSVLCVLGWYLLAGFLGRAALRRATVAGTLEVI